MKMRIAILAACGSTLALAQADVARANYDAASESKRSVTPIEFEPERSFMIAQGSGKMKKGKKQNRIQGISTGADSTVTGTSGYDYKAKQKGRLPLKNKN